MNHWLLKSEPSSYSFDDLVRDGKTNWTGVRNFQAAANLRAMKVGDRAFFYHSNEGKEIVGLAEISRAATPDDTDPSGKFVMVEIKSLQRATAPVTLAQAKADPALQEMQLVRLSRLSVSVVTPAEARHILKLGKFKAV